MWSSHRKHAARIGFAALLVILGILALPEVVQSRAGLGAAAPQPQGVEQSRNKRAEFMRQKLDYSKNLLEGVTLENYEAIARNARALKTLSQAAEWEVPTMPDVENYVPLTTEFQKYTDAIARKARERDLDGATAAYTQLIQSCVKCHKFVRNRAK